MTKNLKEVSMDNQTLERFFKYSSLVSNENIVLAKNELQNFISSCSYDYIHLPSQNLFKNCPIDERGISNALVEADVGIAETGTVVILSKNEQLRLATCLSEELHVILNINKITDSLDTFSKFLEDNMKEDSNYIAFITGASRTADIERVLTIGVHGPVRMKVILVSEEA